MSSLDEPALRRLVEDRTGARVLRSEPLAPGLGLRRFVRLHLDGPPGRLVARIDAAEDPAGRPEGVPPEPALEPLRSHLEAAGLPVPRSFGHDAGLRVDLLEDLGARSLYHLWQQDPEAALPWLEEACALVPRIQRVALPAGVPARERRLDAALFRYKGALFARHSLPLALGHAPSAAERGVVERAFAHIAAVAGRAPQRLAHRDLQSQNLLLHETAAGKRLVLIDLQGALLAPPEYDLVCLLCDSYTRVPGPQVEALGEAVRPALPDAPSRDAFAERFDLLTLSRKGKDHARFVDVAGRRGERQWLAHTPRTARILQTAARRAAARDRRLAELAEILEGLPTRGADPREAPNEDTACGR